MSLTITFIDPRGRAIEASAEAGDNLLRVAQAAGLPLATNGFAVSHQWANGAAKIFSLVPA